MKGTDKYGSKCNENEENGDLTVALLERKQVSKFNNYL